MEEQGENLTFSFLDSVNSIAKHSEELETMLAQTLQVLSKLGNQPPFDADVFVRKGRRVRDALSRSAERLVDQLEEMEELVRTSALITTSLQIDHVLQEVIDTVIYLTGAERAFLMLLHDTDDLTVAAARNSRHENIANADVTFSRGVIKTALEERQPIISTNAQEDERFQMMQSVMRHDLRSIMVIPMLLQGVPLGVLYLDNRLASAVFHKKSIPVLSAFANQAAIAIENARLFQRVQESLERTKREVKRLRIQLDEQKLKTQVVQITDSDYFKEIASLAKDMRGKVGKDE